MSQELGSVSVEKSHGMRKERWRRMADLFQQALEIPPEERDDFLRRACGEDLRLRRAVESLLTADGEAGDFLEHPLSPISRTETGL